MLLKTPWWDIIIIIIKAISILDFQGFICFSKLPGGTSSSSSSSKLFLY
jgi:hypothetical protein